jgi:hypothetical protein
VLALLTSPALCVALPRRGLAFVCGLLLGTLPLWGIVALLWTTPKDAIKLPVRRSLVFVTAGTVWLAGFRFVTVEPNLTGLIGSLTLTVMTFAIALTVVRRNVSPWWVVILPWSPIFVGPVTLPFLAPSILLFVIVAPVWFPWLRPDKVNN